ncbi:MAG: tetratricopeptide repeat protein, partial [Gammaproteobacteria bacterium]
MISSRVTVTLYIMTNLALGTSPALGAATDPTPVADLRVPPGLEDATPDRSVAAGLYAEMLSDAAFGEIEEALKPANKLVELTALEFGPQSQQMATPLTDLALIQESLGDLDNAEQNFSEAILILERYRSPVDRDLITPLMGIGRIFDKTGRPAAAVEVYERARQILRRHDGLYSLKQIEMLDAISASYAALGNELEADRRQLYAFDLRMRGTDDDSEDTVDAMLELAAWQLRVYQNLSPEDQAVYGCLIETDMTFADERPVRCRRPSSRALYNRAIGII